MGPLARQLSSHSLGERHGWFRLPVAGLEICPSHCSSAIQRTDLPILVLASERKELATSAYYRLMDSMFIAATDYDQVRRRFITVGTMRHREYYLHL